MPRGDEGSEPPLARLWVVHRGIGERHERPKSHLGDHHWPRVVRLAGAAIFLRWPAAPPRSAILPIAVRAIPRMGSNRIVAVYVVV